MVIFDTLEISPNGRDLLVEAHVPDDVKDYMKDVYIKSIVVTSDLVPQNQVMPSPSSDYTLFHFDFGKEKDGKITYPKKIQCIIPKIACSYQHTIAWSKIEEFKGHLFYIWIETTGVPLESTPCNMSSDKTVGVAFNLPEISNIGYSLIRELADTCNVPTGLTDFILRYNALKLAIETNRLCDAERIYHDLLKTKSNTSSCGCDCGCHG